MAQRLKIALVYTYNENWIAGAYYILNLIQALDRLDDPPKPFLYIISESRKEFKSVQRTGYPYLQFIQIRDRDLWPSYRLYERIINRFSRMLGGKDLVYREKTYKRLKLKADLLFPAPDNAYFSGMKNRLFWIPDFQERFLPHFFLEHHLSARKKHQEELVNDGLPIVFSSQNALDHFRRFYPGARSRTFVLRFAVTHPPFMHLSLENLLGKYQLPPQYFFCPNQVWAHKNHAVVIKALKILKERGEQDLFVAFSGKEMDARNPELLAELKSMIREYGIENNVRFLGFIDRAEQLRLMKSAMAVIQPSLFEGWSTVVEDAKSMGQHVILSDLPVHREQLSLNVSFFDPLEASALAAHMLSVAKQPPPSEPYDYDKDIVGFGNTFLRIATEFVR